MKVKPLVRYLGLAGLAGSGKDYTCEWLKENSEFEVVRVAFADGVRAEMAQALDIRDPEKLFTKPYSYEVRRALQWWGTELRRNDDTDYWVIRGMVKAAQIEIAATEPTLIVFTDVRFENEANVIRSRQGRVLEVTADANLREDRSGENIPMHSSEVIDFAVDGEAYNGYGPTPEFLDADMAWLWV